MTTTPHSIITAQQLTKTFVDFWRRPRVEAVRAIDFQVNEGEIFGLLGPNGSGKSTTIKMLLGLLFPTSGRLTLFGKPPQDIDVKARIGYLPENTYLYPNLTPGETLDFYGSLFGLAKPERQKRTQELLDMVGLAHAQRRAVGEFSKGMARRIGLAAALINDPALIILDEPTSGLDPQGTRQVKDLILELAKRGKTILLTSHLLADVEDICSRIAILYAGKIHAAGTLDSLLTQTDETRLTFRTPENPQDLQHILSALRDALKAEPRLDHPRQNLEEYFLSVIQAASQQEGSRTSGARNQTGLAPFLQSSTPS